MEKLQLGESLIDSIRDFRPTDVVIGLNDRHVCVEGFEVRLLAISGCDCLVEVVANEFPRACAVCQRVPQEIGTSEVCGAAPTTEIDLLIAPGFATSRQSYVGNLCSLLLVDYLRKPMMMNDQVGTDAISMNAIQQIISILNQYPEIRYEFRKDAIRVLAPDENGYEVALLVQPGPHYTVCLATWHMEFADEHDAIGTFLGGLSEAYRLEVTSRGGVDYLWRIQYQETYGWRGGSAVGTFRIKFWRIKKIRYLQNHMLPLPQEKPDRVSPWLN